MAECPFCKGSITEDLAMEGGRCPRCLIEIPGEEAPTNPGEDAVARQAAEEAAVKAGGRKWVILGLAAVLFLGISGGVAAVLMAPDETEPEGDGFEDFVMVPLDKHQDLAVPESEKPEEVASSGRTNSGSSGRRTNGGSTSGSAGGDVISGSSAGAASGSATNDEPQGASILGQGIKSSGGGDIGLDLGQGLNIAVSSKGPEAIVLEDTDSIRKMVQTVLKTGGNSLKACYESEMKNDDNLRGTWEISFSLNRSGRAQAVEVAPLANSNPTLESCMQRKVEAWTFVPIAQPLRIVKNFSFQSGW